jgi:hypothetical protein
VPEKLDEQALRRPEFEDGAPVVLADGQEWRLPRPRVRLVPDDSDRGFKLRLALPADEGRFQTLMDTLDAATEGVDLMRAELAVARHLLLLNYDLTPAQVADLLQFSYRDDDPEGAAIREAVMGVAYGNAPKPSDGGTESPS